MSEGNDYHEDRRGAARRGGGSKALTNLGWALAGGAVTVLLVLDPLGLHPLDDWLRGRRSSAEPAAGTGEREVLFYRNPMDPTITSAVPAKDEMGMDYVPVYADQAGAGGGEREVLFYRNPMDPTITSAAPTKDEMGMDYVPVYADEAGAGAGEREVLFYRNPMDPTITSPVPTQDEMGMDYVPVYADQAGAGGAAGGAVVTIDPATVQNMNVRVARAERRDVTHHIRTVGYLEYDQQRMVSITTKYSGWIEKVHVNYVGEPVGQGQPLFEIYSPELVQTQQELLSALRYAERLEGAPPDVRNRAQDLLKAARTRLSYWDIAPEQIEQLEQKGEVVRTLTVTAPSSGVVMMRMPGLEGMAVKPGMELFHIAGVSSLWLSVEVFEGQLAFVNVGSRAEVSLSYFPGETFTGRVRYIEPEVSEKTRTVSLLVEVPNRNGKLKAGMFATVVFEPIVAERVVTVPSLAVIRTGERNLVVVRLGAGRFAPRPVVLGHEGPDYVEILEGLSEGEEIVTSSQFLIDSESSLQEAIQKMVTQRQHDPSGGGHAQ